MNNCKMHKFLQACQEAYHRGTPLISDEEFDLLADKYSFYEVGYTPGTNKIRHSYRLYSLQKIYDNEKPPIDIAKCIKTPKLDGAAISLEYEYGYLISAATRGDGLDGDDIYDKIIVAHENLGIPLVIKNKKIKQISGEIVAKLEIPNTRNYAAGALMLKDTMEFKERKLTFIAYGMQPILLYPSYELQMKYLHSEGFYTVIDSDWKEYKQDGEVFRLNNSLDFKELGYTDKHPRGAFSLKKRSDVEVLQTKLLDVIWGVGTGGKVTPVAIFEPIMIEDAIITRATLHNAGFIETMDLHIGDIIEVTRAGGIIPKVVGKV